MIAEDSSCQHCAYQVTGCTKARFLFTNIRFQELVDTL